MIQKLFQKIANWIIIQMDSTTDENILYFYYDFGIWLDRLCVDYFDIYLD